MQNNLWNSRHILPGRMTFPNQKCQHLTKPKALNPVMESHPLASTFLHHNWTPGGEMALLRMQYTDSPKPVAQCCTISVYVVWNCVPTMNIR